LIDFCTLLPVIWRRKNDINIRLFSQLQYFFGLLPESPDGLPLF